VSVGARALTGDIYKGHVFWDTEIFLLPFYTFTWPAAARAMLMYRYHTLPAARTKAESLGYRGALYAWESADTGEETTPPFALGPQRQIIPIHNGVREHHISADIAYAIWQYWQATRDTSFLLEAGAEILLETARFWASRAQLEDDGRYHIRGVIGPDEYHDDVDDNAYTNVMAAFNIECALKIARLLKQRQRDRWESLRARLTLDAEEMAHWGEVQARLITGLNPETGLFEQFAGFFSLENIDLKAFTGRTAPMDVVLGPERTRLSQVVKQADVIMLLILLGHRYEPRIHETNFDYYEPRTGHGSSLSPPAHAVLAARLGRVELAKQLFDETAAIDLDDTMGNAAGGVHIGALGGLWQAAILGFAGLQLENVGIRLEPHLPPSWRRMSFPVQWRRRRVRVRIEIEPLRLNVTLERGQPMSIHVGELRHQLTRGEIWKCIQRSDGAWQEVNRGH
jgi:kojibiose phosphorylase